jgi:phosphoribosyl-AMP cyclohydrolase
MSAPSPDADRVTRERGLMLMPKFDDKGLICAVVQDHKSLRVMMVAWMNADSLALTLESGIAHYWSRSRQAIWKKGETSGQLQHVVEMRVDCDQDALLLLVHVGGDGGCCHVGFPSCFYRAIEDVTGRLRQTDDAPKSDSGSIDT